MKLSNEKLKQILSHFSIAQNSFEFRPMNDGLINDTYLVSEKEKPKYILQRINHEVFDKPEILMGNISKALFHLHGEGYTHLNMINTTFNKEYLTNENRFWRLMEFIPNSTTYNTTTNPQISFEAGKLIGKFHQLLKDANVTEFEEVIPDFHNLEFRKANFYEVTAKASPQRLKKAKEAIFLTNRLFTELEQLKHLQLPLRVCHNDTKLNNILFCKDSDKALCLIDLDTLMKGHFYYDFGDAIRTIVNTTPEDEQNHSKITFERDLFESFVDGMGASNLKLSKKEVESLPWGAIYMPFIHGLRALTDYLDNDRYYKVSYEYQNLDRSLSLFDFACKALKQKDYMTSVVNRKLGENSNTN